MREEIPFNGPTQSGRLKLIGDQRTINLHPRLQSPGDKNKVSLFSCPGTPLYAEEGTGPCRSNGVVFKSKLYFVSGTKLISLTNGAVSSVVGTLTTTTSRVELVAGRDYLALVDGTDGFTWNNSVFAQITDGDFPAGATHITYLDGYFIANKGSSDEFYISTIEDPTAWAALDFANAEANPDDILAHTSNQKDLYLIGETTAQVYYNSGNADFPFDPYPNGVMQIGIEAKYSLVSSSQGIFWLGRADSGEIKVVKAQGSQYTAISSPDLDWELSQMSDATDAIAWIEQDGDRTLYVITFPIADKTFCYDVLLPKDLGWFEKKSAGMDRWKMSGYGAIGNKRIVGSYNSAKFYNLSFTTFTEDGAILERLRRAQIIHSDKKDVTIWEFLLDIQVGVGITTGQGSDPQIMLRYSHDAGKTWSSELWQDLGKIGKRDIEVLWSGLGAEKDWLFEVKVTDPVEVNILAAYADAEESDW